MKIFKPSDFFCGIRWDYVKTALFQTPLRAVLALVIYYIVALLCFLFYYITLPFHLLNEAVSYITEWYLL